MEKVTALYRQSTGNAQAAHVLDQLAVDTPTGRHELVKMPLKNGYELRSHLCNGTDLALDISQAEGVVLSGLMKNRTDVLASQAFANEQTELPSHLKIYVKKLRERLDGVIDIHTVGDGYSLVSNVDAVAQYRRNGKHETPSPTIQRYRTPQGELVHFTDRHIALSPLRGAMIIDLPPTLSQYLQLLMEDPRSVIGTDKFIDLDMGNESVLAHTVVSYIATLRTCLGDTNIKARQIIHALPHGYSLTSNNEIIEEYAKQLLTGKFEGNPKKGIYQLRFLNGDLVLFADRGIVFMPSMTNPTFLEPLLSKSLEYMMLNPNKIITRTELMRHTGRGDFVSSKNFKVQISLLRKVLGDSRSMIRTVSDQGYILDVG